MFKRLTFQRKRTKSEEDGSLFAQPDGASQGISGSSEEIRSPEAVNSQSTLPFRPRKNQTSSELSTGNTQTGSREPLGLHVLHNPQDRKVDIVFVHGLGGTSRLSWSKNKDLDLFWPSRFLPLEPDICHGRIMTFGYNASFLKGNSKTSASVLDFAKDLLFELKYAKDSKMEDLDIGAVPVLFIVHSMGGLVVKEAYLQGQHDPDYQHIIKAVSAILFLSTPHRGTNLAETLNRILQASFISAPKQYISDLNKNSLTLQKLNEQFRHVAPKLDIVSFYETRTTPVGFNKNRIMVLEKESSVLGYPGEISKALDADHHDVCKYDDQEDPKYVAVRSVLKSLVSKVLLSQSSTSTSSTEPNQSKKIQKIFAITELPDIDYIFFRDRWVQGTCTWVLKNPAYVSWLLDSSKRPRMLWLNGGPASGKSILSSFIINNLVEEGACCQYFFFRFGDHVKKSVSALLRSLAYQISLVLPEFHGKIQILFDEATKLKSADARTIWQRIFKSILFKMELVRPLYWVIDGVEESDSPKSLVKLMSEVLSISRPIRILIVSRKTQELWAALQKLPRETQFQSLSSEGHSDDYRQYISQELDISGSPEFKEKVTRRLLDDAQGNFLWIHLAVQRINTCHTEGDIEHALQELLPGMEALFDRMGQSILDNPRKGDRALATGILAWVTSAIRLLTIGELSQALDKNGSQIIDFQKSIGTLCGGFVVVDSGGNVAMVHQTAREYLLDHKGVYRIDQHSAHEQLFKRCMSCLFSFGLRAKVNRQQYPEFLDYAATSWFRHLCSSSPTLEIFDTLLKFLKGPYILTWIRFLAQTDQLPVLVSASLYLHNFAAKGQEVATDTWHLNRQFQDKAFVESWAVDLVKIVGKFGCILIKNPDSIYRSIPPFCPQDSITYQQFGRKEPKTIHVSGLSNTGWDDLLARLSFGPETYSSKILAAGSKVLAMSPVGTVFTYQSSTFESMCKIQHGERLRLMAVNTAGTILATYGYITTQIWNLSSSECVMVSKNPSGRPQPLTLLFTDEDSTLLLGADDGQIWSLSLQSSSPSWQVIAELDDQQVHGSIINSPNCMALSPDGHQIALGYRGHPLSVWEVEGPEPINHYVRSIQHSSTSEDTWGEVVQLTWHPHSGEVFGLYSEGIVFKWHPYEGESQELRAGATRLAVSNDGNFLATGDANGNIKLFSTHEFSIIYSIASQDLVLDIVFSPDARRLYDIRGTYSNVWEPNSLIRMSELSERGSGSDSGSDAYSSTQRSLGLEGWSSTAAKTNPVTALAVQPRGPLYCFGTEEGTTELFQTQKGKVAVLCRSNALMTTEQITWSEDGSFIAFADLSGRVFVKRITSTGKSSEPWTIEEILEVRINIRQGPILQLLFSQEGSTLLVYTSLILSTISLVSKTITLTRSLASTASLSSRVKWLHHPFETNSLLSVGEETIHIWSWKELTPIHSFSYKSPSAFQTENLSSPFHHKETNPEQAGKPPSVATSQGQDTVDSPNVLTIQAGDRLVDNNLSQRTQSTGNTHNTIDSVERVIFTVDRRYLLIKLSRASTIAQRKSKNHTSLLLFESSTLCTSNNASKLEPSTLAEDVVSRIAIVLDFLPRDRLVFFDEDYRLCSWKLPLSPPNWGFSYSHHAARASITSVAQSRGMSNTSRGSLNSVSSILELEHHFFLPGDWISPDCVLLCTMAADGTVFCPRNGEVAIVKCTGLVA